MAVKAARRAGFTQRTVTLDERTDDEIAQICAQHGEMFSPVVRTLLHEALAQRQADTAGHREEEIDQTQLVGAVA